MRLFMRKAGFIAAAFGFSIGLVFTTADYAYAATASGQNCGGASGGPSWETDGPLGAPCIASFNASQSGTARITIKITPSERADTPHKWSFDVDKCDGTLLPSDPQRTYTCDFGPGKHTVYVDRMGAEKVNLTVRY